ncbi:MAG: type II secretion system protein [Elusimicrobiota bacterium]
MAIKNMLKILNRAKKSNNRGMTLVEVLIGVAIMGILGSLMATFLVNGMRFFQLSQVRAEIQRDARRCLDLMNRTIRQAQASTIRISSETNQPPCSKMSFTTVKDQMVIYYQENSKLYQKVSMDNGTTYRTDTLAEGLRVATFAFPKSDDTAIIAVSLSFEKAIYSGTKALQMSVEQIRVMND